MGLKIAQCNIRSLNTSNKLIEDMCGLQGISILSLTEIWHPDVSQLKFLHKWMWNVSIRTNREGGGAATIISPLIKSHPREDLNNPLLEAVWCEIYLENRKILVGSVYIPPDEDESMMLLIETLKVVSSYENVIVMGDFNAKHPMWYNDDSNKLGDQLSEYLTTSDLTIANDDMPTHKSAIIDLTLVKGCKNLISNWSACPEIMVNTDHTMILFELGLKTTQTKKPRWNVRSADWEVWRAETRSSLFEDVMHSISENKQPDINKDYVELRDSFHRLGKDHIGKTKGRLNAKPWWNDVVEGRHTEYKDAQRAMKKRCDLEKVDRFKKARHKFLETYHEARKKHMEDTIKLLDGDEKGMWKAVKQFNGARDEYVVQPVKDDSGNIISSDKEIANEFIKLYGENEMVVEQERLDEIHAQAQEILRNCEDGEGENDEINSEISIDEIKRSFEKMKDNTGYSPLEDISSQMLKNSDESIFTLLHYMYNSWLEKGDLPDETKIDFKQLHRKPNRESYNKRKSYRPICLGSLISKCYLRILRERADWKIETEKGLSFTQEAYRKDRNANDITTRFVQFVQEAWNEGKTVVLAVIDYDSFFENIWHDLAIVKLHSLGIQGKILKTFSNYLSGRKYCIEVNDYVSELQDCKIGVPQGGIPSTTIANGYTKDSDTSADEKHAEFSDDNLKWECDVDENVAVEKLQIRLNEFAVWCMNHNVKLSVEKCKIMVFRPRSSPRPYNLPQIHITGELIEVVEEKRILGTIIDCELNFEAHFTFVEKACYSAFNNIKHLYTSKTKPTLITGTTLYQTLIRTIMDYSTVAITNINEKQLQKMQSIQHKCLRLITQTLASSSREVLNLITNIMPIDLHFKLRASESLARAMSKNSPINSSYEKWRNNNRSSKCSKVITTYRKMELASQQIMKKNLNKHEVLNVRLHDSRFPPFIKTDKKYQTTYSH